MKNIIEFYYNIRLSEVHNKKDFYFFSFGNNNFVLVPYYRDTGMSDDIYKLNSYLSGKVKTDTIILNRYNKSITMINGTPYILVLKRNHSKLSLAAISNLASVDTYGISSLERNNWEILWGNKIDYFEMQVEENSKKFPLIRESFDYFVGMGECAISYLVNTKNETQKMVFDKKVVSHITLADSLYNPINIILDHKARDVSEYIKLSFFNNNYNIFKELDEYFHYNYFSVYGIRVLFARVLYPSFYFDLYDSVISGQSEEKVLNKIISRVDDYEIYLYNVFLYLKKYYDIPEVEWLKKRGLSPHLQP